MKVVTSRNVHSICRFRLFQVSLAAHDIEVKSNGFPEEARVTAAMWHPLSKKALLLST